MKQRKYLLPIILIAVLATALLLGACIDFSKPIGKIDISIDSEISFDKDIYAYTGQEITPEISVTRKDRVVEKQYYTAQFSNNVDPGEATVTVSGTGNYIGEFTATFRIGYAYKFNTADAGAWSGKLEQVLASKDEIDPPDVAKRGYEFSHWSLDGKRVDFSDTESLPNGCEFVANYTPKKYKIEYRLDGGSNSPDNRDWYTVEDIFVLADAQKSGLNFAGWYKDPDFQEYADSLDGEIGNLVLYAKFVPFSKKSIYYHTPSGAQTIDSIEIFPETPLTAPEKQFSEIDGRDKKLVWYADGEYTVKYWFRQMPNADLHLYARWEDDIDRGFLDKTDGFDTIDSFEELVAYIDWICFYNVNDDISSLPYIKVSYVSANVKGEIEKALEQCQYPRTRDVKYQYLSNEFRITMVSEDRLEEPTMSATPLQDFYPQLGNVFALTSKGRDDEYDKFPIDFVEDTFEVETTDQLFYVLSHGYRPIPKQGSAAENAYLQFREIMREICDDSMSDLHKIKAIYEWLIINVYYDNAVAYPDLSTQTGQLAAKKPYLFDAFYLEGVLRGAAVCDGLSKAYAVMCAIEGIDCVRVAGEQYDFDDSEAQSAGHAWNKVQIMGEWYLSDSTWGNQVVTLSGGVTEIAFYNYMLFTDVVRSQVDRYINQNYTHYVAETEFDYRAFYDSIELQLGTYTADFLVQDSEELSYILEYIYLNISVEERAGSTFEIMIEFEVSKDKNEISKMLSDAKIILASRISDANVDIYSIVNYGDDNEFVVFIFR